MPVHRVPSSSPYATAIGFSAGVRAGDFVFVAGTTAVDARGEVIGGDSAYAQAREALAKAVATLEAAGADPAQVVQTRMYITRAEDWREVGRAHGELFGESRPVAAMLVCGLLDPRMLVEVELTAYAPAAVAPPRTQASGQARPRHPPDAPAA